MSEADRLAVTGDPSEIRELLALLRRDPELRTAGLGLEFRRPGRGELGAVTDTLTMLAGNPAVLTAATTTIGVWLGARIRPTRIRLKRGDTEVEVETLRAKRAEAYASELLAELSKDAEPGE
ncbi:hypothetical protein GCM10009853_092560 [Glycomyces scopariae]